MPLETYFEALTAALPDRMPTDWPADPTELLDPQSHDQGKRDFSRGLLAHIQGNILQGHGRDQGALIPFRVTAPGPRPPEFWREIGGKITWAWTQRQQADLAQMTATQFSAHLALSPQLAEADFSHRDRTLFHGFSLSAAGMRDLGVADDPGDPPGQRPARAMVFNNPDSDIPLHFNAGMREIFQMGAGISREVAGWQEPFVTGLAGMWQVAADRQEDLIPAVDALRLWCEQQGLTPCDTQWLTTWRDEADHPREPFGFVDGVSLPAFFVPRKGRDKLGGRWVTMPLSQVLISPAVSERHAGGSFLVLRKLEQNVAAFRRAEEDLKNAGLGAELLIGRERNGLPLAPLHRAPAGWSQFNQFDFNTDRAPARCPFHAHIRKVNPREDADGTGADEAGISAEGIIRAQLVRRGMVYDPTGQLEKAEQHQAPWPEQGTGLMFMAFMSDLVRQFEELHINWVHAGDFPRPGSGTDALLAAEISPTPRRWQGRDFPALPQCIFPQGGEYLYAPPRHWFLRRANA